MAGETIFGRADMPKWMLDECSSAHRLGLLLPLSAFVAAKRLGFARGLWMFDFVIGVLAQFGDRYQETVTRYEAWRSRMNSSLQGKLASSEAKGQLERLDRALGEGFARMQLEARNDDLAGRPSADQVERILGYWNCVMHNESGSYVMQQTPFSVARQCFEKIGETSFERVLLERTSVAALSLLSVCASAFMRIKRCQVCPCWAEPGSRLCAKHSLAARGLFSGQAIYARSQRVAKALGLGSNDACPFLTSASDLVDLLCETCQADQPDCRLMVELRNGINLRPQVKKVLGPDFHALSDWELMREIRRRLDPQEWRTQRWIQNLDMHEAWLEEMSLRRGRGGGRKTAVSIEQACELARIGVSSQAEIARRLGVSRSAVSKWLTRHAEDASVEPLLKLRRPRLIGLHNSRQMSSFGSLRPSR